MLDGRRRRKKKKEEEWQKCQKIALLIAHLGGQAERGNHTNRKTPPCASTPNNTVSTQVDYSIARPSQSITLPPVLRHHLVSYFIASHVQEPTSSNTLTNRTSQTTKYVSTDQPRRRPLRRHVHRQERPDNELYPLLLLGRSWPGRRNPGTHKPLRLYLLLTRIHLPLRIDLCPQDQGQIRTLLP